MEDQRRSPNGGAVEMERYHGQARRPPSYDFRSYSTSTAAAQTQMGTKNSKFKKGKSTFSSSSSSSSSNSRSFSDPEFQRKKRVAGYKMYSVEGRMKGSFRNSFRWFKDKYSQMVYGWW